MQTKIVYSIISSSSDNYCEQLILSLHSLRMYNPDVVVEAICDKETAQSFTEGWRTCLNRYSVRIIAVETPQEYNNMERSRFLKTNLRKFVKGDYLFIDCDTIICGNLDAIDSIDADVAACADLNADLLLNDDNTLAKIAKAGFGDARGLPYYNSGVMLVRDTLQAHQLYEQWFHLWLQSKENGIPQDQPALCMGNMKCGKIIKELDGIWNCQFKFQTGYAYLKKSLIMHYFTAKEEKQFWNQPELMIYERIREKAEINNIINELLLYSKTRLYNTLTLNKDAEFRLITAPIAYIFFQYPTLFSLLDKLGKVIVQIKYRKII